MDNQSTNNNPAQPDDEAQVTYFNVDALIALLKSEAGYRGLYAGLTENDIHALKKLAPDEEISDWMDSEELGANIFRATQTDAAMRRGKIKGRNQAYQTHFTVGRKVREFIINELGGTPPEELPTPEKSIKQLEREEQFKLKHKDQPSLFDQPPEENK